MIDDLISLLSKSKKVLITTHKSPDGDAVDSAVACYEFLKSLNKSPFILIPDMPASNLMAFLNELEYECFADFDQGLSIFDLTFCLDYIHDYRVGEEMSQIFTDLKIFQNYFPLTHKKMLKCKRKSNFNT